MRRRHKKNNKKKLLIATTAILLIIGTIIGVNMQNKKEIIKKEPKENNKKEPNTQTVEKTNTELEKAPKNHQEFLNLKDGEYITETGHKLLIKDNITYVDNQLIVNKTYSIPESFQPQNPTEPVTGEKCNNCLNKEVMEAYNLMKSDATSLGLTIYISSGYRSYSYQQKLYNNYVSHSGKEGADTYSARPGHSEHQTGTCFDLNTIDDSFANTNEGKWVNENAYLYGFIIRYPKGKESITGYQYESWHLRYVGKELAKELYNNGNWKTLEEYYGITSSYE